MAESHYFLKEVSCLSKKITLLRGFKNRFKKDFSIVNLSDIDNKFNEGDQVNAESLFDLNLNKKQKIECKNFRKRQFK